MQSAGRPAGSGEQIVIGQETTRSKGTDECQDVKEPWTYLLFYGKIIYKLAKLCCHYFIAGGDGITKQNNH
jgi:hypothetical protein